MGNMIYHPSTGIDEQGYVAVEAVPHHPAMVPISMPPHQDSLTAEQSMAHIAATYSALPVSENLTTLATPIHMSAETVHSSPIALSHVAASVQTSSENVTVKAQASAQMVPVATTMKDNVVRARSTATTVQMVPVTVTTKPASVGSSSCRSDIDYDDAAKTVEEESNDTALHEPQQQGVASVEPSVE